VTFLETDPGNPAEERAKGRGFGFYASHLGRLAPDGYYMKRWILRLPFGFTIRLHQILRSDGDRHLHDHPFDFTSLLLTGGYTEITPCDECNPELSDCSTPHPNQCTACFGTERQVTKFPRFSINRKRAEAVHALLLHRPVLTLVFAGPKRRDWGFQTEEGWVHNEHYSARWPERSSSTKSRAAS
jgi:hypothetical protein